MYTACDDNPVSTCAVCMGFRVQIVYCVDVCVCVCVCMYACMHVYVCVLSCECSDECGGSSRR